MSRIKLLAGALLPFALLVGACETSKSSNPLSPSIAGPIPWVNVSAPKVLEPPRGAQINTTEQPLTLLIENASSNGPRPLSYTFEIATDAECANKVFVREGITPGDGGRTALRLPDALQPERTYFWRVRAADGANSGPFVSGTFSLYTPVIIDPPTPLAPVNWVILTTRRPELRVRNSTKSGPAGSLVYAFEVSRNDTYTQVVATMTDAEGPGETAVTLPAELDWATPYFWRARAYDSGHSSDLSRSGIFYTPKEPVVILPPPPTTPPPGGYPNNGPDIVAYVERQYPSYLVAGVSVEQRIANMQFLRDRVIETGICGGLDLAWNLKRGVGPHSIDAIAWRHDGIVDVVDLGAAYDDTSQPLRLHWIVVEGPPGYDPYSPRPACR
jgi:hypothetical protein